MGTHAKGGPTRLSVLYFSSTCESLEARRPSTRNAMSANGVEMLGERAWEELGLVIVLLLALTLTVFYLFSKPGCAHYHRCCI